MPKVSDSFIAINHCNIVRTDTRGDTHKHGICIYVRKDINFISLNVDCSNVCTVHPLDFNLCVVVVYRPPSYDYYDNLDLVKFLSNFCPSKEVLILGDFNLPMISWHHNEHLSASYPPVHQLFMDCFISLGLHQWVLSPTFVHSGNILDLVLTTESDRVGDVRVLTNFSRCDHCPVVLQYYFQTGVEIVTTSKCKYSWHRGNYNRINSVLEDIDWDYEFCDISVDSMFSRLKSILSHLID